MQILDEFITHQKKIGYKDTTLRTYRYAVTKCCATYGLAEPTSTDLAKIGPDEIRLIYNSLDICENSKKCYISYFGQFLKWATGSDVVDNTPILWNRTSTHVKFMSVEDYNALIYAAEPTQKLILMLGAQMGLRRAEMANLRLTDIHGPYMTIRGKGHGRDGLRVEMEIPPEVQAEIDRYKAWRADGLTFGSDYLLIFTDNRGRKHDPKDRLQAVAYCVHSLAERYGIDASTHSLRRLYATVLYRAGYPIDVIAAAMRHSSPATTWRYIQRDSEKVSLAVQNIGNLLKV